MLLTQDLSIKMYRYESNDMPMARQKANVASKGQVAMTMITLQEIRYTKKYNTDQNSKTIKKYLHVLATRQNVRDL